MEKHFIYFNQKDKCNRKGNFMHCAGIYLDCEGTTTRIKGRVGSVIFKDERFLKKIAFVNTCKTINFTSDLKIKLSMYFMQFFVLPGL